MAANKKYIVIGAVILVIIAIGYFVSRSRVSDNKAVAPTPTNEVIPTVDSSVIVDLESVATGREVLLKIDNIPTGTEMIEYELSYQTAKQGMQGVIGTIATDGKPEYEKQLTLGTCSSGTCVYHQVVGAIKLTLKFSGEYGERIFEKEFEV